MRHPIVCPHGCGPITATWTRRGATLAADTHDAVCPRRPRARAVEDTWSQMLRCQFGCGYLARYQIGQYDMARQAVTAHERSCGHRFTR